MAFPKHGALGMSFVVTRLVQVACLVAAMGMTARLVAQMVEAVQRPPPPLVGILSITCLAIVYTIISCILYYDGILPLLPNAFTDCLFFIALMIASIIIGKPLSYLSCKAVGEYSGSYESVQGFTQSLGESINQEPAVTVQALTAATTASQQPKIMAATATATAYVTQTVASYATGVSVNTYNNYLRRTDQSSTSAIYLTEVDYSKWVGGTETTCVIMKGIWGFGIALTILFVFSSFCCVFLWKRERSFSSKNVDLDST